MPTPSHDTHNCFARTSNPPAARVNGRDHVSSRGPDLVERHQIDWSGHRKIRQRRRHTAHHRPVHDQGVARSDSFGRMGCGGQLERPCFPSARAIGADKSTRSRNTYRSPDMHNAPTASALRCVPSHSGDLRVAPSSIKDKYERRIPVRVADSLFTLRVRRISESCAILRDALLVARAASRFLSLMMPRAAGVAHHRRRAPMSERR